MMIKGYIAISILLIVDLVLYFSKGISFLGQISDKAIFWIWLIMTPILIAKNFRQRWAKWYLGLLCLFLVLSLFPMGIPFLTIAGFATYVDDEKVVESYRLREGAKSVIAIPKIMLFKEQGIFEREVGETDFYIEMEEENYRLADFDTVILREEADSIGLEFVKGNQTVKRKIKIE